VFWNMSEKIDELKTLRDELKLKLHLMEKDLQDQLHEIMEKVEALEQSLLKAGETLGKAEEHLLVGSDEEIEKLIADLRELEEKHDNQ